VPKNLLESVKQASYLKFSSILLIICLGILAYSNSFFCSFHFDDAPSIVNNPAIKNLYHLKDIWNFWPCRFICYLSIAFNYHLNGLHEWGYHFFNLTVHLLSAFLVWWLTLLTLSTPLMRGNKINRHRDRIALFAALIFVSHPLQTEAVTYIVQRAASMATMFYLASLCLYIKFRTLQGSVKRPNCFDFLRLVSKGFSNAFWVVGKFVSLRGGRSPTKQSFSMQNFYYTCSLISAILAMFCKEIAITLPIMILLYEYCFLKNNDKLNWRIIFPFLCALMIIPLTMGLTHSVNFQEMHRMADRSAQISTGHYFLTQCRVIVTYIRLLFWPINQNLDYDYPVYKSLFQWPVLTSILFLLSILAGARFIFSKYRLIAFSIFWFFLTLLPESSLIPIKDVIFEHRLYLPLVGFSLFFVSSTYYFLENKSLKFWLIILSMTIACFSILTYQRNKVWANEFTLWNDIVQKSPHKARGYNNRGFEYYHQGDYTQAILDYDQAITLDPKYADAYNNRGIYFMHQSNPTQAIADFDQAIKENPKDFQAYYNRGMIYHNLGQLSQAIKDYSKAIELNPNTMQAYNNRAVAYYQLKQYAKAWQDVHKTQELGAPVNPDFINLLKMASRMAS